MAKRTVIRWLTLSVLIVFPLSERADAQFAAEVLSYDAGSTPAPSFTVPAAAIGWPERMTGSGSFPSVVSPFSPPYLTSEIVSVGLGGHLTLRLSNYALSQAAGPEIGVFTNVGIVDADYPNGLVDSMSSIFSLDRAVVDISANGADWVSLGALAFDIPTNGFNDTSGPYASSPGGVPSDFQQPNTSGLASFADLSYTHPANFDLLDLYAGSGGGTWIDISPSGLNQVGYIRFSVPDDIGEIFKFELDAVSIAHQALGALTVPEPGAVILTALALLPLVLARRQQTQYGSYSAKLARVQARQPGRRLEST